MKHRLSKDTLSTLLLASTIVMVVMWLTAPQITTLAQSPLTVQGIDRSTGRPQIVSTDSGGKVNVNAAITPSGTQDANIVKVGGNAVTTSIPVAGIGTAGTANTGVVTVQGIASMTPLLATVSGTVTANQFCSSPSSVAISTSASGNTQLVAVDGSKAITICNIAFTTASAVDIKFVQGTKVTTDCDTGATDLSGTFTSISSIVLGSPLGYLTTSASKALCINLSGTVAVGGTLTYKQQ